jgi:hypothetical protein
MHDPTHRWVQAWGKNPVSDLAFVRVLLTALIEGSQILDVDAEARARWRDIRDNLAPYPVRMGQFASVDDPKWDIFGPGVHNLASVYPAGEIGLGSSPELQRIAQRTYRATVGRAARAGHAMTWCAASAAHLGDAESARSLPHDVVDTTILENGLQMLRRIPCHRVGDRLSGILQIDATIALSAAVTEMLLQSLDGVIRVFPAVPRDWNASFETLRAVGAFLVSARMAAGKTTWVQVDSEHGGPCAVSDPFGCRRACLRVSGAGAEKAVTIVADEGEIYRFETEAGGSYELTPARDDR